MTSPIEGSDLQLQLSPVETGPSDSNEVEVQSSLRDPTTAPPSETFCQLLSSLPPSSIATSIAVSTNWRNLVHANLNLHREVDLSKVNSCYQTMQHFNRISSLALDRLLKVSLNLSSFWEPEWWRHDRYEDKGPAIDLLMNALSRSRETLRDVSLELETEHEHDWEVASRNGLPFLSPVLEKLFALKDLDKISIIAPTYIWIKAGTSIPGFKSFEMNDTSWYDFELEEASIDQSRFAPPRLKLMKDARKFAGNLVEFGGGGWVWNEKKVMKELRHSRSTLQELRFGAFNFNQKERRKL